MASHKKSTDEKMTKDIRAHQIDSLMKITQDHIAIQKERQMRIKKIFLNAVIKNSTDSF